MGGGGKLGMDFVKSCLLPIVLALPQRVYGRQYQNQSIRLDLLIVLRSIFLTIGQKLTKIGDIDGGGGK